MNPRERGHRMNRVGIDLADLIQFNQTAPFKRDSATRVAYDFKGDKGEEEVLMNRI